jgi:hypothetical protein
MKEQGFIERERNSLDRLVRFRLPNYYKRIGIVSFLLLLVTLITFKFTETEPEWVNAIVRQLTLLCLWMISFSKDKVEDEMIALFRSQAYAFAFLIGVFYAMVQPYVSYGIDLLLQRDDPQVAMDYVRILSFMLLIQILSFETLKRLNR